MFVKRVEIFRAFGFPIYIDLSWLFIAVLVTWSLAAHVFPFLQPGLNAGAYWAMGFAGAMGLFASIVLHELGHALIARREGMRMRGITLFIFGGVAELEDEPPSARSEFFVAVAGPVVSIVIGVICLAVAWASKAYVAGGSGAVTAVLGYLGTINLVLVAFNLIPAFPLDGGRVLRSALWHWWGSLKRATRVTATIGLGFGIVLIVLGVVRMILGDFVGGLWWILLGAFLRFAAQMSYQQVLLRRVLEGEKVADLMVRNPQTVPPDASVAQLVEDYIYRYHHKMFPVATNGTLLGCVSTEQVKQVPREAWATTPVQSVVQPCTASNTISPDEDAMRALSRSRQPESSRMLVVQDNRLVGIVTLRDLMKVIAVKLELEEDESLMNRAAG